MDLTAGQYVQLAAALLLGIVLFVCVYRFPERVTIAILLIMIPIQLVDSRFGTSNMVMTYLVAFAFLLQGRMRAAPLMVPMVALLLAYGMSIAMSYPPALLYHVFYLIGFFSNVLIFYLVYNFVIRSGEWKFVLNVMLVMNVLVVIVCLVELAVGNSQINVLGASEWGIKAGRAVAGRIVGPFGSTHTTADYIVSQCVLLAFFLVYEKRRWAKLGLVSLLLFNFMVIVATGDRGGFVGLCTGALLFLALFRSQIGVARAVRLLLAGGVLLGVGSVVVVNYTDFGVLYDRLSDTEVDTGLADARERGFKNGLSYFEESPVFGLGPDLAVSNKIKIVADIPYRPYPHILVMYILGTLGIVGFIAWGFLFSAIVFKLFAARPEDATDQMLALTPRLGLLVLALFFAGELRIEFLRRDFLDYQNYVFAILALFIACADMLNRQSAEAQRLRIGELADRNKLMGKGAAPSLVGPG